MSSLLLLGSACVTAHTPLQSLVKMYLGNSVNSGMIAALSSSSVVDLDFLESSLKPCHYIISPNNRMLIHPNRYLSLLSFRFYYQYIHSTFSNISSLFLSSSSKPAIKISSAIPNTFGMSLYNSSFFLLEHISHWGCSLW